MSRFGTKIQRTENDYRIKSNVMNVVIVIFFDLDFAVCICATAKRGNMNLYGPFCFKLKIIWKKESGK